MFRVSTKLVRIAGLLAALVLAISTAAPPVAQAGSKGHGQYKGKPHLTAPARIGGRKTQMAKAPFHGHRAPRFHAPKQIAQDAARSGVLLTSGRNTTPRYERRRSEFRHGGYKGRDGGRHFRGHGGAKFIDVGQGARIGGISIVAATIVGSPTEAQNDDIAGGATLEGACAPGEYCTVRLGPYVNSPKIITLNTAKSAPAASGTAQHTDDGDAETMRRYDEK